jgi:hypothetical protein
MILGPPIVAAIIYIVQVSPLILLFESYLINNYVHNKLFSFDLFC